MKPFFRQELSRGIFEVYTEKPPFDFFEVEQVHGKHVVTSSELPAQADGLIASYSEENSLPLAIKTADCLPIVVEGERGFALLHAGWRGIQQQIYLTPRVRELIPNEIFVGPHIQVNSFEVTEEFRDHFPQSPSFFATSGGRLSFNLFAQVQHDFGQNFPKATVVNCLLDTVLEQDLHSYRRDNTAQRNYNIYRPRVRSLL